MAGMGNRFALAVYQGIWMFDGRKSFIVWREKMIMVLELEGLLDVVAPRRIAHTEGSREDAAGELGDEDLIAAVEDVEGRVRKAKALILSKLSDNLMIQYKRFAVQEIWSVLQETYGELTISRMNMLEMEIKSLRFRPGDSFDDVLIELNELWNELDGSSAEYSESKRILALCNMLSEGETKELANMARVMVDTYAKAEQMIRTELAEKGWLKPKDKLVTAEAHFSANAVKKGFAAGRGKGGPRADRGKKPDEKP